MSYGDNNRAARDIQMQTNLECSQNAGAVRLERKRKRGTATTAFTLESVDKFRQTSSKENEQHSFRHSSQGNKIFTFNIKLSLYSNKIKTDSVKFLDDIFEIHILSIFLWKERIYTFHIFPYSYTFHIDIY